MFTKQLIKIRCEQYPTTHQKPKAKRNQLLAFGFRNPVFYRSDIFLPDCPRILFYWFCGIFIVI